MSKKLNFLFNALTILVTIAVSFICVLVCANRYQKEFIDFIIYFLIGLTIGGFLLIFFHEIGHIIFGKINGFAFLSCRIWFLKFYKTKKKVKFVFSKFSDAFGATEMVAINTENLKTKFKNMTIGGLLLSLIVPLIGLIPLFVYSLPFWLTGIIIIFLPVGCYSFLINFLPIIDNGFKNDGAILLSLKKMDDDARVMLNLLSIQSDLFNGKTPAEIDKSLYFDLPQLPEDNVNFINLLMFRYCYYLDMGEFENAKNVTERLLGLEDYMSRNTEMIVKTNALYNYCTFDKNEEQVDSLMYELEKYLNSINNATNIRVKLAYILFVGDKNNQALSFYKKGIKEAKKCQILGLGMFEAKLLDILKKEF